MEDKKQSIFLIKREGQGINLNLEEIRQIEETIRAVKHPERRSILELIGSQGLTNVTNLCQDMRLPAAIVSQHLGLLRKVGMLKIERRGKYIYYDLVPEAIDRFNLFFENLFMIKF